MALLLLTPPLAQWTNTKTGRLLLLLTDPQVIRQICMQIDTDRMAHQSNAIANKVMRQVAHEGRKMLTSRWQCMHGQTEAASTRSLIKVAINSIRDASISATEQMVRQLADTGSIGEMADLSPQNGSVEWLHCAMACSPPLSNRVKCINANWVHRWPSIAVYVNLVADCERWT